MNGTPIFDIKPYLPFTDSHPEAVGGFTQQTLQQDALDVEFSDEVIAIFEPQKLQALKAVLEQDPRPHYQHDSERIYGMMFSGKEIHFSVNGAKINVFI